MLLLNKLISPINQETVKRISKCQAKYNYDTLIRSAQTEYFVLFYFLLFYCILFYFLAEEFELLEVK